MRGKRKGNFDDANLKNTCTNKTVLNTNVTTGIKALWVVNAGNSLRIMCGPQGNWGEFVEIPTDRTRQVLCEKWFIRKSLNK